MAVFTEEDKQKLEAVTAEAAPETLVLRDEAAGASFAELRLANASPVGTPTEGTLLWSDGGQPTTREPRAVTSSAAYADSASGGFAKAHRTYFARASSIAGSPVTAIVIGAASLPAGPWSAHLVARAHAYDVTADRVHKVTREAGVRRTTGALVVPPQTQNVGFDQNEGETPVNMTVQVVSGDLVIQVLHLKTSGVHWSVWVELFLVAH